MKDNQSSVILADNFPSKTYLLITHLTETNPAVASFSSDGLSIEIYNQHIFATEYLPQYFKHNNYGSFVRQLNLYGFTSSRLPNQNDVVVWRHDNFQRGRKDLIKDIQRAKKTKKTTSDTTKTNGKPAAAVYTNTNRTPSPQAAYLSESSDNNFASPNGVTNGSTGRISIDQSWLESQFMYLHQQNKYLESKLDKTEQKLDSLLNVEQKLDTLLKITLSVSSASSTSEELQYEQNNLGDKRRKISSPIESSTAYADASAHHQQYEPAPYHMNNGSGEESKLDNNLNQKMPPNYNHHNGNEQQHHQNSTASNDSYKRFIDIMLNEDGLEEEEGKETLTKNEEAAPQPQGASTTDENHNISMQSLGLDSLDDELMQRMVDAGDTGMVDAADAFDIPNPEDDLQQGQDSHNDAQQSTEQAITMMANANVDKTSGPEPIRAISSGRVSSGADIEEGGVHVIEAGDNEEGDDVEAVVAHAELVDGDSNHGRAAAMATPLSILHVRDGVSRKKVFCMLALLTIAIIGCVTWPVVIMQRKNRQKQKQATQRPSGGKPGGKNPFRPGGPLEDLRPKPGGKPSRPNLQNMNNTEKQEFLNETIETLQTLSDKLESKEEQKGSGSNSSSTIDGEGSSLFEQAGQTMLQGSLLQNSTEEYSEEQGEEEGQPVTLDTETATGQDLEGVTIGLEDATAAQVSRTSNVLMPSEGTRSSNLFDDIDPSFSITIEGGDVYACSLKTS